MIRFLLLTSKILIALSVKPAVMKSLKQSIALVYLCASLLHAETIVGRVVAVSDGDTIKVLDDNRKLFVIRLKGIDAPEKAQSFGQRAKQSLLDLAFEHRVEVHWSKRDRYGRIVGKVVDNTGADICLEQIARGMAWHYQQYASEQSAEDHRNYASAEDAARAAHIGLWSEVQPTPPWAWRRAASHGNGNEKSGAIK
jgi:endonuclease YncB( thermonuclease family)